MKIWETIQKLQQADEIKSEEREQIEMPDIDVLKEDIDADVSNHLKLRDGSIVFNKHGTVTVSDNRRPIYAILTEPFRGQISSYGKE